MTSGSSSPSSLFCAAVIASAHGVRGHVKIKCFLEDPSQFMAYSPYCNDKGEEIYKVSKIISQDKDTLVLALEGVSDRSQAELMKGTQLMLPREHLPRLSEDTYYHQDLIGLSVKSSDGSLLGTVQALYNFGAGDLLEVKTFQDKLEMVPFRQEFVPEVNMEQRVLLLSETGKMFLTGDNHVS